MRFDNPADTRLWLVQQRQLELIHHAESSRLARSEPPTSTDSCDDPNHGFRGWLGGLLVSAGRAIDRRGEPCNDPCPDVAFR
jgi:hypothetical protein